MTIRCKFAVQSVTDFGNDQKKVNLTPQYDQSIPEDQRFAKATPSGEFSMWTNNPVALEQLVPGKKFYIDLTPAD